MSKKMKTKSGNLCFRVLPDSNKPESMPLPQSHCAEKGAAPMRRPAPGSTSIVQCSCGQSRPPPNMRSRYRNMLMKSR